MSQPPRSTRPNEIGGETADLVPPIVDSVTLMGGRRELIIRHGADTLPSARHRFEQADPHQIARTPGSHPFPVKLPSQPVRITDPLPARRPFRLGPTGNENPLTLPLRCWRHRARRHDHVPAVGADAARCTAGGIPSSNHACAFHDTARAHPARRRDDGGDAHPAAARRRAGHRLGDHDRGHRSREHAGRPRPGAQRARRHGRQQSLPRRLPELRDPRHRRQPRAAHVGRHAHARLPRTPTRAPAPTPANSPTSRTSSASRSSAVPPRRSTAPTRSAAWWPTPPRIPATTSINGAQHLRQRQGRLQRRQPAVRRDLHRRGARGQSSSFSASTRAATATRFQPAQSSLGANPDELVQQRLPGQARLPADRCRHDPPHRRLSPRARRAPRSCPASAISPALFATRLRRMGAGLHQDLSHQRAMGARRADRLRRSHRLPGLLQLGQHPGRHVSAARRRTARHPDQLPATSQLLVHPERLRRRAADEHQRQAVRPAQLLHLRPVASPTRPTTRPRNRCAGHAGDRRQHPDGGRRDLPQQELPRHRHRPGRRLRAGRDHGAGRPAHRHAGGAARLLQAAIPIRTRYFWNSTGAG